MNTPLNTAHNSGQEIHSLKDLIGFDIPKLTKHYSDTTALLTVDCDDNTLDNLKSAVEVANMVIHDGIEAISNLLLTIEINCPSEINTITRIHSLEISGALNSISIMQYELNKAEPVIVGGLHE